MAVGGFSSNNVLEHSMDLGNQPRFPAARDYFLAHSTDRSKPGAATLAGARTPLGSCGTHQYLIARLPARVLPLDPLSLTVSSTNRLTHGDFNIRFHSLYCAVAGAQLRNFREVHFHTLKLWSGTSSGKGPGADGTWMEYLHPTKNAHELNLYRQTGEVAYVAQRQREAIAFIRAGKLRFTKLCSLRFIYYWGGFRRLRNSPLKMFSIFSHPSSRSLAFYAPCKSENRMHGYSSGLSPAIH